MIKPLRRATLRLYLGTLIGFFFPLQQQALAATVPNHGVILLYHHVADDTPAVTSISPGDFAAQMQHLEDNGFIVWPLPKLVAALQKRTAIPDKVVAITFDDNYRSVYRVAFPLLKQRGWPFTIFVSTDAVDHHINMQSSWEQMREMARSGATIANHSATHAHLLQRLPGEDSQAWTARITADIDKAQRRIAEETGQQHRLFAYPYGEFNRELAALVKKLGYVGIGQQSGPAGGNYPGLALPRFPFAGNYSKIDGFSLKILTLPLPLTAVSAADSPLDYGDAPAPMTLQLTPGDISPKGLHCYGSGQGALDLSWLGDWRVRVTPTKALPVGRSRYNCTLATGLESHGIKRYFWYSHPWIKRAEDGHLPD